MNMFKVIILTISVLGSSLCFAATGDIVDPCEKVVLAGDAGWVPYTIVNEDGVTGLAMDIANRIFSELDIPIMQVAFHNRLDLVQALRSGDIDLYVSTYPDNDVAEQIDLISTSYIIDPITVAVKKENKEKVQTWEDLTGYHGLMDVTFAPDHKSQEFFNNYLTVRDKMTLPDAIDKVIDGDAFYVLGSDLQLRYAIQQDNLEQMLSVAQHVQRIVPVHMGFVKTSPCKQYAAFITKRLQDYKNDGTVEKLVDAYILSN